MLQTAGVTIERNAQGVPCFARIDLMQYRERLMPFFKEIGLDKDILTYNKDYVDMINQAEKDIKAGKGKKIAITDLWQ
ncbi:hypothetical protein FACS1894182_06350 [Bacteroidia bacterium]|nr:hypothetical protein FACS1894182_06350 [Bacteroidia bacterium]